jgi:hypothetical protein
MNSIPINLEIKRFQNLIEKIKESIFDVFRLI